MPARRLPSSELVRIRDRYRRETTRGAWYSQAMHRALAGLLAVGLLAGCGGSSNDYTYHASDASMPGCVQSLHPGTAIGLPAGFPKDFPFPHGTLVAHTNQPLPGETWIYGYVPSTGLAASITFFRTQTKKAGYRTLGYYGDGTDDSGGRFAGHGYTGRWYVEAMKGCKGALRLAASAKRTR